MSLKRGFTLIELLVVIAVLALLAGILFPVFSYVREDGRRAKCESNLMQIGKAYLMYLQDYDQQFPPVVQAPDRRLNVYWSPPNLVTNDLKIQSMYASMGANAVINYTHNMAIWACPSATLAQQFPGDDIYNHFIPGVKPNEISYQFNGLLGTLDHGVVKHPAEVPMVWEGPENRRFLGSNINNPGVAPWIFSKLPSTLNGWPFAQADCSTGLLGTMSTSWGSVARVDIHHGGQNWLYVDGHVKWRRMGGRGDTDPWQDPFNYNPDGSIRSNWADVCDRPWLFRPDYEPKETEGDAIRPAAFT